MSDPWSELGPIYRVRKPLGKRGIRMTLKKRPAKIVVVIRRDGTLMAESDYSLRPFDNDWHGENSRCLFFRKPEATSGLTVLFEAATPGKNRMLGR